MCLCVIVGWTEGVCGRQEEVTGGQMPGDTARG